MQPTVAIVLLSLAGLGSVLHCYAACRLGRFLRRPAIHPGELPPITFWRAIKPGISELPSKLESLASAARPGDQILVGIDRNSAELDLCLRWKKRHPEHDIELVECDAGHAVNPKISKFCQMRAAARHPHWLLTDSEALLTRLVSDLIREEWLRTQADALTAGYRFTGMRTVFQWLDTLPAPLTLWPGLMLIPRLTFTLGACTALRAADLDEIGGWERFGDRLAEDHELGQRLTAKGKTVTLSRAVLDLDADALSLRDYLRHQHRLAVTYRAANPAGFAGLPIFHSLPLAVFAVALFPACWPIALGCAALRSATGFLEARALGMGRGVGVALIPITLLLEGFHWLVAWLPLPVWWAGRWRQISWRGRFRAPRHDRAGIGARH